MEARMFDCLWDATRGRTALCPSEDLRGFRIQSDFLRWRVANQFLQVCSARYMMQIIWEYAQMASLPLGNSSWGKHLGKPGLHRECVVPQLGVHGSTPLWHGGARPFE